MRAHGPYEVKPRQLRALVLLLALLPLIPVVFVVRFVSEDIANQRLETRERARPVYQKFLGATSAALSVAAAKVLPEADALDPADPWRIVRETPGAADTVLLVTPDGQLSVPPLPAEAGDASRPVVAAQALARAVVDGGLRYALLPRSGAVRWRFLGETREAALFGLHPPGSVPAAGSNAPSVFLVKTRQHLLEKIGAFYQRELDPQTALRLIDENGEGTPLVGPADAATLNGGELLAEATLQPPLPAWRVQLFSLNSELVDGIAREQITFYWWSVAAMIAVTVAIAAAAGWALTRRLALHELSNDALAVVSHEMKTPLASVRLFVETLLDRRYRGGEQAADEYLRLIAQENARLEQMVGGFQTLSRLESVSQRRAALRLETLRVDEVAAVARERLRSRLEAEDCDFQMEIDAEARPFRADREALAAVLVNLLDNALKYSGGEKHIVLRAGGRNGQTTFEVSDRGEGIALDEQNRIFERFYQSDRRLSRAHEGCGLGLSIVRSVVKAHGGTVSVQSVPGQGSTFTVKLPNEA